MPEVKITHSEQWVLEITPGEGEKWDDLPAPYDREQHMLRPERVRVVITRGAARGPLIQAIGRYVLKTGGLGRLRMAGWHENAPEWLRELSETMRRRANLGPGVTGVDW